jgi:predicted NAD/FAD-binding protein
MLREILRFNRLAPRDLESGALRGLSLNDYLDQAGFGARFREYYLLPMGAAIWSSTEADMAGYPAEAFVRFFKNHRLMNMKRPKWRTVIGGSRTYVRRIADDLKAAGVETAPAARSVRRIGGGVAITDADGRTRRFDEVILACHSDQALKLLADADYEEREFLGAIPYAPNEAVLHRDQSLLPRREAARAAWCYLREGDRENAAVTYDMNRLQGIDGDCPLFVTLNPSRQPDPALTFARFEYDHPQFTAAGMAAQRIFNRIQGVRNTWFAGAWLGYGFHEDGLRSGLRAALKLGGRIPWDFVEGDIDGGGFGARLENDHHAALMTAAE